MMLTRMATAVLIAFALETVAMAAGLDFETYRKSVEPLFLTKRPGHARCIVCHEANASAFHLETLAPGAKTWTEEQSRRNFENVSHLVVPGDPAASKLAAQTRTVRVNLKESIIENLRVKSFRICSHLQPMSSSFFHSLFETSVNAPALLFA